LTEVQWRIVGYADVPRSLAELMAHAGYRQRPHFVTTHLEPLLTGGVLRPTIPDKPRSSRQRYVLTEAGIQLKLLHEQAVAKPDEENGY
jgi:ATP-dependent DNA helicase RecG